MNNIDTILQSADLPEIPVETLSDERQAKILSGAMQLVRQDAKKRSRRRTHCGSSCGGDRGIVRRGSDLALRVRFQRGKHLSR